MGMIDPDDGKSERQVDAWHDTAEAVGDWWTPLPPVPEYLVVSLIH